MRKEETVKRVTFWCDMPDCDCVGMENLVKCEACYGDFCLRHLAPLLDSAQLTLCLGCQAELEPILILINRVMTELERGIDSFRASLPDLLRAARKKPDTL